jgi:hypothetical protein
MLIQSVYCGYNLAVYVCSGTSPPLLPGGSRNHTSRVRARLSSSSRRSSVAQVLFEAFLCADVSEGVLHCHGVSAHHAVGVDVYDVHVVE